MKRRDHGRRLFDHSPADTYLLASFGALHWPDGSRRLRVIDLGCGPGRLLYEVAQERPEAELFGLEVQPELLRQAEEALGGRGVRTGRSPGLDIETGRCEAIGLVQGDLRAIEALSPAGVFDIVFINPPYFQRGDGRLPPDPIRAGYRHEGTATLDDFLCGAGYLLAAGGCVFSIYPYGRMKRFEAAVAGSPLRIAVRQEVFPEASATEPCWTLCLLVPLERYCGAERLEPVYDPNVLMGFCDEQEQSSAA